MRKTQFDDVRSKKAVIQSCKELLKKKCHEAT